MVHQEKQKLKNIFNHHHVLLATATIFLYQVMIEILPALTLPSIKRWKGNFADNYSNLLFSIS